MTNPATGQRNGAPGVPKARTGATLSGSRASIRGSPKAYDLTSHYEPPTRPSLERITTAFLKWIFFSLLISLLPFGIKTLVLHLFGANITIFIIAGNGSELFLLATAMAAASLVPVIESRSRNIWKIFVAGICIAILLASSILFAFLASVDSVLEMEEGSGVFSQEKIDEIAEDINNVLEGSIIPKASLGFCIAAAVMYLLSMLISEREK